MKCQKHAEYCPDCYDCYLSEFTAEELDTFAKSEQRAEDGLARALENRGHWTNDWANDLEYMGAISERSVFGLILDPTL